MFCSMVSTTSKVIGTRHDEVDGPGEKNSECLNLHNCCRQSRTGLARIE
jgi:hypothetical protein